MRELLKTDLKDIIEPGEAAKQQQQMELRTTAVRLFRPRLMQVPGVTEVFILGGEVGQVYELRRTRKRQREVFLD